MLAQLAAFWGLVKETESHILVRLLRLLLCFDLGWGCGGGSGGSSGGRTGGVAWKHALYHVQKREPVGICCYDTNCVLCDNLEGWGGEGGAREVPEGGGDMCIPVADSC